MATTTSSVTNLVEKICNKCVEAKMVNTYSKPSSTPSSSSSNHPRYILHVTKQEIKDRGTQIHSICNAECCKEQPVTQCTDADKKLLVLANMYSMLTYLKETGFVTEFSISGPVENTFLTGIVDRLEWDPPTKTLSIIDLKTHALPFIQENPLVDYIGDSVRLSYSLQLHCYWHLLKNSLFKTKTETLRNLLIGSIFKKDAPIHPQICFGLQIETQTTADQLFTMFNRLRLSLQPQHYKMYIMHIDQNAFLSEYKQNEVNVVMELFIIRPNWFKNKLLVEPKELEKQRVKAEIFRQAAIQKKKKLRKQIKSVGGVKRLTRSCLK